MLRRSKAASLSIACSGAWGAGRASRTPSTNWSQPFCAMASRSSMRAHVALGADVPVGALRVGTERRRQARARDLRERVRLVPVHPGAAVLDRASRPSRAPRPPTEAVAGLEQHDPAPAQRALAGGRDAGEATADDGHVVACRRRAFIGARPVRIAASTATAPGRARSGSPTSTGLHSTVASPRSSSSAPTCAASRAAAGTSAPGRPRPPSSSGAPRRVAIARSIRGASAGSGMTATSSSSSVQIPPRPTTSAGTIPSVCAATISSTPGGAIRSTRITPSWASASGAMARWARRTSLSESRPRATPPSSVLCWTRAALSLSATGPSSSRHAATASSSSSTARP